MQAFDSLSCVKVKREGRREKSFGVGFDWYGFRKWASLFWWQRLSSCRVGSQRFVISLTRDWGPWVGNVLAYILLRIVMESLEVCEIYLLPSFTEAGFRGGVWTVLSQQQKHSEQTAPFPDLWGPRWDWSDGLWSSLDMLSVI